MPLDGIGSPFSGMETPFGRRTGTALLALLTALSFGATQLIAHPLELGSIYQDRAGTTLVTAPGQQIGFAEDWGFTGRKPILGPELVANGDFSAGNTSWTVSGNDGTHIATFSGGTLRYQSDTTSPQLNVAQADVLTIGKTYLVEVVTSAWVSGSLKTDQFGSLVLSSGVGTTRFRAVATATSFTLTRNSANVDLTIDNISVRELPGYHATAISDAARGIYAIAPDGGVRNLLTYTEQFDNAAWQKTNLNITTDAVNDPTGALTADKWVPTAANVFHDIRVNTPTVSLAAGSNTLSAYAYAGGYNFIEVGVANNGGFGKYSTAVINLATGANAGTGISLSWSAVSVNVENAGGGWYRIIFTFSVDVATTTAMVFGSVLPTSTRAVAFLGDGASGAYVWGAQLEAGSSATPYQKVVSKYEVTEAGKASKPYVEYLGINTAYATAALPAPGVDKAQVFAGFKKLGTTAAYNALLDTGTNGINGLGLYAPTSSNVNVLGAFLKGQLRETPAAYPAGGTHVMSALHDIAGTTVSEETIIRVDGAVVAVSGSVVNAGTFSVGEVLYYGSRAGTSLFFYGNHYRTLGPIVRFSAANASAAQIAAAEAFYTEALAA